jgi:O-antigen ligase
VATGIGRPRRLLLCAYAAAVPFGSGITLPVPLPAPFNTLTTLLGLGTLAVFALGLTQEAGQARRLTPAAPIALLLLAVHAGSYLWSIDRAASFDAVLVLGSLVALFVVVSAARLDEDDLAALRSAIVAGGVLACLYGFALLLAGRLPEEAAGVARFATAGGVGDDSDPNITAATLVLPLVVATSDALDRVGGRRLASGAAATLIAAGILLTASRGGTLGAVVATTVLVVSRRPSAKGVLGVVAGIVVVVGMASVLAPAQFDRLGQDGSSGRTSVWELGLAACEERCAIGSGIGTYLDVHEELYFSEPSAEGFRSSLKAHNIWLQAGVETGIMGVLVLLALLVALVAQLLPLDRRRRAAPLAALLGLVVTNAFLGNLGFKYFWLVLVLVAVTATAAPAGGDEPTTDPVGSLLVGATRRWKAAVVVGAAASAAVLAFGARTPTTYRSTAVIVATMSPDRPTAGIDEAIEATFEARDLDDDAQLRARGTIAYEVTAQAERPEAAAAAADLAATALVAAFTEEPLASTRLALLQRADVDLAARVGGPPGTVEAAGEAALGGVVAAAMTAVGAAGLAHRRSGSARSATAPRRLAAVP